MKKNEQAQRRAAGDRSGRKYSKISITKSVNFGALGPFCPFLKRAPELIKNGFFQKLQFLLFYFVTLSLLTKNYVSITKTAASSSLGPLRAPQGPF